MQEQTHVENLNMGADSTVKHDEETPNKPRTCARTKSDPATPVPSRDGGCDENGNDGNRKRKSDPDLGSATVKTTRVFYKAVDEEGSDSDAEQKREPTKTTGGNHRNHNQNCQNLSGSGVPVRSLKFGRFMTSAAALANASNFGCK